jgi:uncharacterized membrane protein
MSLKKITIWTLTAVVFIVGVLSYPAYRQIRMWRASAMATEAESMLATPETMSRAWELAHAASSLSPNDPAIARTLARLYSAGDPASAYSFWERVVELSTGAPDDRLELARAYLHASRWQAFDAAIAAQREDALHPRQLDYLQALAATLQGDYEQALSMATALVAQGGAPPEADALFFQLARLSAEPTVRRTGIDHLWTIAVAAGLRQEEAIKTLARLPDLEVADIERLIDTVAHRKGNSRDMRLLAEELRFRLPEPDRKAIYDRSSTFFELGEPAELAIFGRWLNRHGLHQYTRRAMPLETATKRQDLFLIHLDAMALDQEWEAIRTLLDRSRVPLEDYLREFFRMRTFFEMEDMRRARLAWDRALVAAARESPKLYYLANKARQLDLPEFEIAALQRVIESPAMRLKAMKDLIAVHQQQGNTNVLLATLIQYNQYFPGEREAQNDALYLSFLIGQAAPDGLAQAKELLEAQPNVLAYRMTLVLGLLRKDRSAEALDLLLELPVNWFEVRDRWRLLAALALHREGFQADAQTLAADTDPSNLLPEELRFIEEISP